MRELSLGSSACFIVATLAADRSSSEAAPQVEGKGKDMPRLPSTGELLLGSSARGSVQSMLGQCSGHH